MRRSLAVIFIIQSLISAKCFICSTQLRLDKRDDGNAGEPLFLTPFVESGNITEGKRLARVNFTDSLQIKSYAGYFTVNKTYDSNHFFWYFPSISAGEKLAPVIVWLQGGPGASSLDALFTETGPIRIQDGKFERREYNWASDHHLIYIDNPVGTGFSFTKSPEGYCTDETQIGEQLYSTLTQFFKLFPKLQQNKFFITGSSYAGKYVPALAYTIHKKNPSAETKINLKGLAIGNGVSDPEHQFIYSKYFYQLGLIDRNAQKALKDYEDEANNYIKNGQWVKAYDTYNTDIKYYLHNVTGYNYFYNYLYTESYTTENAVHLTLQKSAVRKDIHVGDLQFNDGQEVLKNLQQDVLKSVAPWVSELLDHYSCVIYNGQLDMLVPYTTTVDYLRNLNFTGVEEYKTAERHIWKVDGEIAGYVKEGGNLVEILVRNAGHNVPRDQPKWALDLITKFTHDMSFYDEGDNTNEESWCK